MQSNRTFATHSHWGVTCCLCTHHLLLHTRTLHYFIPTVNYFESQRQKQHILCHSQSNANVSSKEGWVEFEWIGIVCRFWILGKCKEGP